MEPIKKTGTVRALILTLSACTMLLTGVFVATNASATDAQGNGCPADFALAADGASCFQLAQSQTTTTAPKCATGTLTPSGTHCYLPAVVTPQTSTTSVANVPTTTYACPAGSTGSGSGAALTCSTTVPTSSTVANVATTTYSCPAGSTAAGSGAATTCTTTVPTSSNVANVATTTYSCPAGSTGAPTAAAPTCATSTSSTVTATPVCGTLNVTLPSGNCKKLTGTFTTIAPGGTCALPMESDGTTHADGSIKCYNPIPPATCSAPFAWNGTTCSQTIVTPGTVAANSTTTYSCPAGSTASGSGAATVCTVAGSAQQPVANVANTAYSCPAGTTASGAGAATVCTKAGTAAQAVAATSATSYACPAGTVGAGSGAALTCSKTTALAPLVTCKNGSAPQSAGAGQSVCIVGDATITTASVPFCAKGTLSADKTTCVLGTAKAASVTPAFTG